MLALTTMAALHSVWGRHPSIPFREFNHSHNSQWKNNHWILVKIQVTYQFSMFQKNEFILTVHDCAELTLILFLTFSSFYRLSNKCL